MYFFFFNDTATTEIYTLSLHDALPIYFERSHIAVGSDRGAELACELRQGFRHRASATHGIPHAVGRLQDRKSTRLNSSHANISYAVFCLKKKQLLTSKRHTTTLFSVLS